jgi:hypothetical protein
MLDVFARGGRLLLILLDHDLTLGALCLMFVSWKILLFDIRLLDDACVAVRLRRINKDINDWDIHARMMVSRVVQSSAC